MRDEVESFYEVSEGHGNHLIIIDGFSPGFGEVNQ